MTTETSAAPANNQRFMRIPFREGAGSSGRAVGGQILGRQVGPARRPLARFGLGPFVMLLAAGPAHRGAGRFDPKAALRQCLADPLELSAHPGVRLLPTVGPVGDAA